MRSKLKLVLVTGAITATVAVPTAADAAPATGATPVSCTPGQGCDGKDPVATGCAEDAVTLERNWAHDYSPAAHRIGVLSLQYSKRCHTTWGQLRSLRGKQDLAVELVSGTESLGSYYVYKPHVDKVQSGMKWLAPGEGRWRTWGMWFYNPKTDDAYLSFTFADYGFPCSYPHHGLPCYKTA